MGFDPLSRLIGDTSSLPGQLNRLRCTTAGFYASRALMDMDFRDTLPAVRRSRLVSGFCSSARTFAPRFVQTPPHGDGRCASLTLDLHQVG